MACCHVLDGQTCVDPKCINGRKFMGLGNNIFYYFFLVSKYMHFKYFKIITKSVNFREDLNFCKNMQTCELVQEPDFQTNPLGIFSKLT